MRVLCCLLALGSFTAHGQGGVPSNDLTQPYILTGFEVEGMLNRSMVGMDITDQNALLASYVTSSVEQEWIDARNIFLDGKNSYKSSGMRTISGFCQGKLAKGDQYNLAIGVESWPETYCNTIVEFFFTALKNSVIAGNALASDLPTNAQVLLNINYYSYYELWDGYYDFTKGTGNDNEGGVKAIDEGWAFYVCIDQPIGATNGTCGYAATETVARGFGQQGSAGQACEINAKMLAKYNQLKSSLALDESEANNVKLVRDLVYEIGSLMLQSTVQTMYWYGSKYSLSGDDNDYWNMQIAAVSIRPQIGACSECGGGNLDVIIGELGQTMAFGLTGTLKANTLPNKPAAFNELVAITEYAYPCMHITCADIGALSDGTTTQCTDPTTDTMTVGVQLSSNVQSPMSMDSDIRRISKLAKATGSNYDAYYSWNQALFTYQDGWSSPLFPGASEYRSLQSFGSNAEGTVGAQINQESPTYPAYSSYWGGGGWADSWLSSLFPGGVYWGFTLTGAIAKNPTNPMTNTAREQMVVKGATVENMQEFSWGRLGNAIKQCENGELPMAADNLNLGLSYYIGRNAGKNAETSLSPNCGNLAYSNAIKRAGNYEPVVTDGRPNANIAYLNYAGDIQTGLAAATPDCDDIELDVVEMILQSSISNFQGMQRYAYKGNKKRLAAEAYPKERAEGWAFTRAVLPLINACNTTAAMIINETMNFFDGSYVGPLVYETMSYEWGCLGLTCSEIGNLTGSDCGSEINGVCPSWTQCVDRSPPAPTPVMPTIPGPTPVMPTIPGPTPVMPTIPGPTPLMPTNPAPTAPSPTPSSPAAGTNQAGFAAAVIVAVVGIALF